ncbi:MAG TPA: hypothetical protein VMV05_05085 [bacterium]|nr:hypothetical protein [bacterium]
MNGFFPSSLSPLWFNLVLLFVCQGLVSCAGVARDLGMEVVPDVEMRQGITGTQQNPAILDPFKKYHLVMSANECRFFAMKVPEKWYWKVYLTAANHVRDRQGHLEAKIAPADPPWSPLPDADFQKKFNLDVEGMQAVLGVGNGQGTRMAFLKLCQDGAPLDISIESQISATNELMVPTKTPKSE